MHAGCHAVKRSSKLPFIGDSSALVPSLLSRLRSGLPHTDSTQPQALAALLARPCDSGLLAQGISHGSPAVSFLTQRPSLCVQGRRRSHCLSAPRRLEDNSIPKRIAAQDRDYYNLLSMALLFVLWIFARNLLYAALQATVIWTLAGVLGRALRVDPGLANTQRPALHHQFPAHLTG